MSKISFSTLLLLILCVGASSAKAQAENRLQNPNADFETRSWTAMGEASVEESNGNRGFVVRNGGYFFQDVALPEDAVGKYAVLIGRGSSERINHDGSITGLPYLYGYMMAPGQGNSGSILDYLQGMLASPRAVNEWVTMAGIFKVPAGTGRIRFFLNQAERKGLPQNGSVARFDDLGLYLFPNEADAKAFVALARSK